LRKLDVDDLEGLIEDKITKIKSFQTE